MNEPAADRTQSNIDAFIEPAPETSGLKLRPFSAGTLTICRALGLTMITGASQEQLETMSADDKQRQLTTFLFIQSQPLDAVKKAGARKPRGFRGGISAALRAGAARDGDVHRDDAA